MISIQEINNYDEQFIERFRKRSNISNLSSLSHSDLENILLQRRFLSLAFTPFYDLAIDGLEDEGAKQVARELIREEYPHNAPSHREDLVADLLKTGLTKVRIVDSRPTPQTKQTIENLLGLVNFDGNNYDIKTIAALKLAGELLVAEEYKFIVPELVRRYSLNPNDSRFYVPHLEHDKGHSNRFNRILCKLILTDQHLEDYILSSERACDAKSGFYNQFRI